MFVIIGEARLVANFSRVILAVILYAILEALPVQRFNQVPFRLQMRAVIEALAHHASVVDVLVVLLSIGILYSVQHVKICLARLRRRYKCPLRLNYRLGGQH